ncbi:phage protein Gp27 family protein [Aristophania vespae]|uniref:phage protein Gp27 family protein n=1 Tax=Aristophania vespae TaxID=2697033 RepID=UPI002351285F|nr:phage protein Gp27 family protein [Aristophania vespae]
MPRPSTVSRLADVTRQKIGELHDAGCTIDDIMQALPQASISRTALERHIRQRKRLGLELKRSRNVAENLVTQMGNKAPGQKQVLLTELFHTMLLDVFMKSDSQKLSALTENPKEFSAFADAIYALAHTSRPDAPPRTKTKDKAKPKIVKAASRQKLSTAITQQGTAKKADAKLQNAPSRSAKPCKAKSRNVTLKTEDTATGKIAEKASEQELSAEVIAQIMAEAFGAKLYNADSHDASLKTDNKAGAKIAATSARQGLSAKTIEQIMAGAFGVKSHNASPRSAKSCEAPS